MTTEEIQTCAWKGSPRKMDNPLHTTCSYMAMFPPALPKYFIQKYSKENDAVLDPFSGRGTTVLEACTLKRVGIGNDKNPLAYLLTKAKSNVPSKGRILARINKLEKEFNSSDIRIENEDPHIKMIFSDSTLKQILFLKRKLKWRRSNVDAFIAAMILGVMHGGSSGYLSLSMPNTFSMSPNYVKNYIREHGLKKPERNAFDILRIKTERCHKQVPMRGRAFNQDIQKMSKIRGASVKLIITSPPYTRVIRYGQFNWIRLWFLGKKAKEVDKKLFFSQSLKKYLVFMKKALKEMRRVLIPGGKAVLVIGDVRNRENEGVCRLAEYVWEECAKPLGFKLSQEIIEDVISDSTKVSRIWGNKRGNATKIDRILILTNPDPVPQY